MSKRKLWNPFSWLSGSGGAKGEERPLNRQLVLMLKQPVWTPNDYRKLATEGYMSNPYVFGCVHLIAKAASTVPWKLYREDNNGERTELKAHPLLKLWNRPNPETGRNALVEALFAYLLIKGDSYLYSVGPDNKPPRELYTLRPDKTKIISGTPMEPVLGYKFGDPGSEQKFKAEDVMHLKEFHPLNDWYGFPQLKAASRSVDSSNEAKKWNVAQLQNQAIPPGALMTEEPLDDKQFAHLKQEIEEQYAGSINARRPMLLEGGMKWEQWALTAVDMDWLNAQKLSASEIALAYEVPAELVGIASQKTFSNYQEARKALYQDNIAPKVTNLAAELNVWLVPKFERPGENLVMVPDFDMVPALQEDRDALFTRVASADWLEVNEKRRATGYDEKPGYDVLLVPISVVPLGGSSDIDEDENGNKRRRLNKADDDRLFAFNLTGDEQRGAHWKAIDARRRALEKTVKKHVAKRFDRERRAVNAAIKGADTQAQLEAALSSVLSSQAPAWEDLYLNGIYLPVGDNVASSVFRGLKAEVGIEIKQGEELFDANRSLWLTNIAEHTAKISGSKISDIFKTTKKEVARVVLRGITEGLSIPKIKQQINALYEEKFTPIRAETIARTETISASNYGSRAGAIATDLPLEKEWISTLDDRTRDGIDSDFDHLSADGQRTKMDEAYVVSGEELTYPGDITHGASAGNVINCRCTEGYHVIKE